MIRFGSSILGTDACPAIRPSCSPGPSLCEASIMKRHLAFVLTLFGILGLLGGLSANDKKPKEEDKKAKEKEKKKSEPMKPVVVDDQWIDGDAKDKMYSNSFMKSYIFKMEKDKTYEIELQSKNGQAALRLESDKGNQLATDADFGNQGAVIIHKATKTEDFHIIATSTNFNTNVKFTLTVKELTGDEGKPIELKLDKGSANFSGNIARSDPRYNNQKIHKLFVIKLEEGKNYQIEMRSRAMDSYLYLIGPDGTVLAQDDDGGGRDPGALSGLDSKIVHKTGKAGEYRIVATSLGGRQTGDFIFKISEK
jgi:hypothetical protein